MKKVVYTKYGNEDVLQLQDFPIPSIKENQLLIKVKSVSINPLDWKLYGGEMKMMSDAKFPKSVGIDFSGIVENIGSDIRQFKKGNEVFGLLDIFNGGALAEYIVVTEKDITLKPGNISFEQAAALPVTGLSALQIVDKLGSISKGREVLINGAAGGIGMFAIQLAKRKGAIVTAVLSSKGLDFAKKWGSDIVVDYTQQNILKSNKKYDVVIDLSGRMLFKSAKAIMKAKATFINTIPSPKELIGSIINNFLFSKKHKILILKPKQENLNQLSQLAIDGLDIMIYKEYPLSSIKVAYKEISQEGVTGKAVITI